MKIVMLALFCAMPCAAFSAEWNFDDAVPGKLPAGWTEAKTGEGPGSVWEVREDAKSPSGTKVLAQVSSEGAKRLFNLCVAGDEQPADVEVSVRLKALSGKIDQGGGPVWRYQDANNYYIARLNPLEFNYRVYKVVEGKRIQLATADVAPAEGSDTLSGIWHTIRVVHRGTKIACYLNGKLLLEADDAAIQKPGKVGLWTKADAVTSFDDLKATSP
jgi:hypothetical protein